MYCWMGVIALTRTEIRLSYSWQMVYPKNVKINLDNDDSAKPDFVAPSLDGTCKQVDSCL